MAPAVINIYDSDMTHEFVVQSRVPACAANSRLPLQQHRCFCCPDIFKKSKRNGKIKAKVISILNSFSFDYESERILSEHGSSGRRRWVFAS